MKKFGLYILLIILPFLLFFISFRSTGRPFWLFADPHYAYLLNSLTMAQFDRVWLVHHPGTTVEILGAITIKIVHFFCGENDLVHDVSTNPELYLATIYYVLVGLNVLVLLAIGLFAYVITRNIWLSFLIQLTPFLSKTYLVLLCRVSADPLLLPVILLFVAIIILTFKLKIEEHLKLYTFLFALITGLGLATKVTFIPLVAIPILILPKFRWKGYYFFGAVISFVLFTLPIITEYPRMINYFLTRFVQQGLGPGKKSFIDTILLEPFLLIIILISIFVISISVPNFRQYSRKNFTFKLLLAVTISQIFSLIMVMKHPQGAFSGSARYLISALGLSGITLVLIFNQVKQMNIGKKFVARGLPYFVIVSLLIFVYFRVTDAQVKYKYIKINKDRTLAISQKVEKDYKECAKIYNYFSSSIPQALFLGNQWASYGPPWKYSKELKKIYSNDKIYFYKIFDHRYFDWSSVIKFEKIQSNHKCIIFISPAFEGSWSQYKPNIPLEEVYRIEGRVIYKVK
ncbi:MAG: hypothetical protein ACE5KZ_08470 [Candidatus Scalinduaceae bacterium]